MAKITGIVKSYDGILGYYTAWLTTGEKAKFKNGSFQIGDLVEGDLTSNDKHTIHFLNNVSKVEQKKN